LVVSRLPLIFRCKNESYTVVLACNIGSIPFSKKTAAKIEPLSSINPASKQFNLRKNGIIFITV
jgi:hypothetical protein